MPSGGVKPNPSIRPVGPVTPADVENVRESFRLGLGVADTARKLGLSTNQVTRVKRDHGLTSTRGVPQEVAAQATEAFSVKARRNRQARYERLQAIDELVSGKLLKVLAGEEKHMTILRGAMGMEGLEEVDAIPSRDLREVMTAIVQNHLAQAKIEDKEEDGGQARALSVLDKFIEAVGSAAQGMPEVRPGLIQE